jgi:transposase
MGGPLRPEDIVTIGVLQEKGMPGRAIARTLGVTEGAVRYHRRRQAAGASDGRRAKPFKARAVAEAIAAWIEGRREGPRPVNVRELYEHLVREQHYAGSYLSVLRFVRRHYPRPRLRTYRRVETPPGAQSQTDWGEYPRVRLGGAVQPLHAFVMVLSHSRLPAVVWSEREDLVSWLACHNGAFRRLGGIPAVNRIDNVRTGISVGAGAWGTIQPTYRAYARAVGFHIDACPPRTPTAKGKVEAKVRLSRLLLDVSQDGHGEVAALQASTDEAIGRWARRTVCPATGDTVWATWQAERAQLAPLPLLPEPFDIAVLRPVHRDCTVHFERRQYTVPFALVGRHVEVRGCARTVQIVADGRVVQEYPRHTAARLLLDPRCYEGEATDRVLPPPPLGRMGQRLQELWAMPVAQRPLHLYAHLAEVAR